MSQDNPQAIAMRVPENVQKGVHANVARVTTTENDETIVDFAFVHPQDQDEKGQKIGTVVARVILPVKIAKQISNILGSQLGTPKKGD